MLTHHFVTISLISVSLMGNFTRIGNAILVCQSFADIFLPLAKVFGYVQMGSTRDKIFIIFVVAWIVSRQIWLPIMVYSVWADLPVVVGFNYDPTVGHFLSYNLWLFYVIFLTTLCLLMWFWLYLILRIVYNSVILKKGVSDVRSSDEEHDD